MVARLFCQVLFKPGRTTFVWSEGKACFEPYHLEGEECQRLESLARSARQRLTQAVHGKEGGEATGDLAGLGRQMYRAIFRLDGPSDPAAQAVYQWWQNRRNDVPSLDVLSNSPGRVPWNLVCEETAPGEMEGPGFWGFRYPLGVGRRVSPYFPLTNLPALTALLLLEESRQKDLSAWARDRQLPLISTSQELQEALEDRAPDLLYLSGQLDRGRILWGEQSLALDEITQTIQKSEKGNPLSLLVLALHGPAAAVDLWECFLGSIGTGTNGAVVPEVPLPEEAVSSFSQTWLPKFLEGGIELGEALRRARAQAGLPGLAWSALAPAGLCLNRTGENPPGYPEPIMRPLPEQPYSPFKSLDPERRMFLAGRQHDILRGASLLEESTPRGLLLHGGAASGKSSFIRAGLLPFLEEESIGFQALRDRTSVAGVSEPDLPALTFRTGPDPLGPLCLSLALLAARPLEFENPAGTTVRLDLPGILAQALNPQETSTAIRNGAPEDLAVSGTPLATPGNGESPAAFDTAEAAQKLYQLSQNDPAAFLRAFDAVTRSLPWEPVLVLEQAEDLVSEGTGPERGVRRRGLDLLSRLTSSTFRCRIILSARTEYLGPLLDLIPPDKARSAWREFFLAPLSEEGLEEVLLLPTATEPLSYGEGTPHSHYQFYIEEGLNKTFVQDVLKVSREHQLAPLPLLHITAAELFQKMKSRNDNTFRAAQLKTLGPLQDIPVRALDRLVLLQALPKKETFLLLDSLARPEPDGAPRAGLVPFRSLAAAFPGGEDALEPLVTRMVEGDPPLVEAQDFLVGGRLEPQVSLANDSLAQIRKRDHAVRALKAYGWTSVFDTLWIMIPLVALAAALAFFFTSRYQKTIANQNLIEEKKEWLGDIQKQVKEYEEEKNEKIKFLQEMAEHSQFEANMSAAWFALRENDLTKAKGALISNLPLESAKGKTLHPDLRSFDWYHLWRRLHPERFALVGHPSPVSSVAISPDGKLLASASLDGTIKLWDADALLEIQTIPGKKVGVHALTFTADGKALAAARSDKTVHLFEVIPGKEETRLADKSTLLEGHDAEVISLAVRKGQPLVSADKKGKVIAWDPAKAKQISFFMHKGPIRAVSFIQGNGLAVIGAGGKVVTYDLEKGKETGVIETAQNQAEALALDEETGFLAVGGALQKDGTTRGLVTVVDTKGKGFGTPLELSSPVRALTWVQGMKTLVIGTRDHALRVWNPEREKVERTLRSHLGWVNALASGAKGLVLSGGQDSHVKVWSLDPSFEPEVITASKGPIRSIRFTPDGKVLASGDAKGAVKFWEVATGKLLHHIEKPGHGVVDLSLAAAKEGAILAIAWTVEKGKGQVGIVELKWEKEKYQFKELPSAPTLEQAPSALALTGDGQSLYVAEEGGKIGVWNLKTGLLDKAMGPIQVKGTVAVLKLGVKDAVLLAGTEQGEVRIFHALTGKEIVAKNEKKEHAGAIRGIALLPGAFDDLGRFLTIGEDGLLKAWSWNRAELIHEFSLHRPTAATSASLVVGETTSLVVTGMAERGVQLGKILSKTIAIPREDKILYKKESVLQERGTLEGPASPARAVAVSPDETVIAAGCQDGSIWFWRAATPGETLNPRPR